MMEELNENGLLEIPSGFLCASDDGKQLICPFMWVRSKTDICCNIFLEHVEAARCYQCARLYPRGAVIEIKPK